MVLLKIDYCKALEQQVCEEKRQASDLYSGKDSKIFANKFDFYFYLSIFGLNKN